MGRGERKLGEEEESMEEEGETMKDRAVGALVGVYCLVGFRREKKRK